MRKKDKIILRLLREKSPRYGLELVKAADGKLGRGSVYVHLHRLEDEGFVTSKKDTEPNPITGYYRWQYSVAGNGRKALIDEEAKEENFDGLPDGLPA
jgi:DNA-binding PadR family transcriptional regulator